MTIFECWNSFSDFPGPSYDSWTKCPQKRPMLARNCHIGHKWFQLPLMGCTLVKLVRTLYFISGTVSWVFFAPMKMSLGGPRRPQKWPILARHCHIGHKWFHLPQMGSTLVKLGSTLYFMSGTVIWEFFSHMEMSLGVPWKWLFCPKITILAISDWSPLKWVHHWMNNIEYGWIFYFTSHSGLVLRCNMSPQLFHTCSTFSHPFWASRAAYGQISTFMAFSGTFWP